MKKDLLNETFQKHTFLLKKKLYEQGVIQQQPIQEVELEEGFKDIALASLLGLSTLFSVSSKADTTSPDGKPSVSNVSVGSELSRVKSAKQNAQNLAEKIAVQLVNPKNDRSIRPPGYYKDEGRRIVATVSRFNDVNYLGSKSQMGIATDFAQKNDAENVKPMVQSDFVKQFISDMTQIVPRKEDATQLNINFLSSNEVQKVTKELGEASKNVLIKKYNTTDENAIKLVGSYCESSALGDFLQMVAQAIGDYSAVNID